MKVVPVILYSLLVAVVMSLVFVTMGQLYVTRQDESVAVTDAALTAAGVLLQIGSAYEINPNGAVQSGMEAYQHAWDMQTLDGLTTVGTVSIDVESDHVSATGEASFTPIPLWPLAKLFPGTNFGTVTITRTGTAIL